MKRFTIILFPLLWRSIIFIIIASLFSLMIIIPVVQLGRESQLKDDLLIQARLVSFQIDKAIENREYVYVNEILEKVSRTARVGITLISPEKRVYFQGEADALSSENLMIRQEIQAAINNGEGTASRYSTTFASNIIYAAIILPMQNQEGFSILRLSAPVSANVLMFFIPLGGWLLPGFAVIILFVFLIFYGYSRKIMRPVERLAYVTRTLYPDIPQKDLSSKRSSVFMFPEINHAVHIMYALSKQLKQSADRWVHRQLWETSILAGMTEGVLAIDVNFHILVMNPALAEMFHITRELVIGERVEKVFPGMSIINLIEEIFQERRTIDRILTILENHDRFLQVIGTPLFEDDNNCYGVLLVIRDVTNIRRLETVRREFASNVSHELKTPLTSIKGYVETLIDDPSLDENKKQWFLSIVKKQTERVIAIIEDLLQLSGIEKDIERNLLSFEKTNLYIIICDAVEVCTAHSRQKKINIHVDCPEKIMVRLHPHLFEQAMVNLIDNAVKYSNPESTVNVSVEKRKGEICVRVQDFGCGIPSEHLPRLFERFYRVDKARSRDMGGTGLGLAIVKHIIQAHQGRYAVESNVGKGSTFTLCLPDTDDGHALTN
ncbi:MAG: PAS domain-containing protein [Spirochaetales bacterium]|nr:PAS domain-containing protein [Spirochaetales bacterium]